MKYLDALNERNNQNKELKNQAMNRPTAPTGKVGKHSTDGRLRGRKEAPARKVRGVKIRPGDTADVTTAGRTGQTTASNRLTGRNRPTADLTLKLNTAGPKKKLPEAAVYRQIGRMIAEVLSPQKHAKVTGGGQDAAKRREERMRKVMSGNKNKRPISPIAGVEAVDKPGVTLSKAAKAYRDARKSGASERPTNLKPSYSK